MSHDLLGYLLNALEPHEAEQVEQHLEQDPDARQRLNLLSAGLSPLAGVREPFDPPSGLAQRTCLLVAGHPTAAVAAPAELVPTATAWGWRRSDYLIAAGVLLAAGLFLFPALHTRRFQAQLTSCQNNLRALGQALVAYSQHQGGYFPHTSAEEGPLAVAGIYAPLLHEAGFLSDPQVLVCPGCPKRRETFRLPSLAELKSQSVADFGPGQPQWGGSYGLTLGHLEADQYVGTKNRGRASFALAADVPDLGLAEPGSSNHGPCGGQNVLFEDGHAQFCRRCQPPEGGDHFFLNDDGVVAAGKHAEDAVIAPSTAVPFVPIRFGR